MKIVLNGIPLETATTTLADLVREQGFGGAVATAINEEFVSADDRAAARLNENDRVEVLAPMQGG